jgi:hypothetical protein
MITPLLRLAFDPVHQRQRRVRRLRLLAISLCAAAIICAALLLAGMAMWRVALATLAAFAITRLILGRRVDPSEPDYAELARAVEARYPELHAMLLTAVEQRPDSASGEFHLLQQKLIEGAVAASGRLNWVATASDAALWRERVFVGCSALLIAFVLVRFGMAERLRKAARVVAQSEERVTVTPGDTSLERGSGLIVLADFHRTAPGEATLLVQPTNQPAQRIPLIKNLDDPVFGGGLPEVDSDLTYRIEYAGQATRNFTVMTYEHPRLDRADATLHFPKYTKLPEKTVPDTHRVSAVEGATLNVKFQLNKPVKSASLVAKDGTIVPLAVSPDKPAAMLNDFPVVASETYELKLEDADGRANKIAAQFTVDALKNRPPELKFEWPKGDQKVSPIEEIAFRGQAWDDFGLSRYGITVNTPSHGDQEILLGKDTGADENREFAHLLKLEDLGVKADDLVSWFLWAEDTGPDGRTRRTESDILFAEVRPFDQIYRRDNGGGEGGGGGGGGEAEKMSDLQKQIVSATWNLERAEAANTGPERPSAKYLKDEPVVRDSQAEALQRAEKVASQFDDPKTRALADNATQVMKSALDRLSAAASDPGPLSDALKAEEAAYDALLKLAAHEYSVRLSKSQGKAGGQEKQQLEQLEMEEDKQKYETKKEAEPMEKQQQREQLAILNRLKELAQRQQDVNERLKELQNALQAARTDKEKDEVRRQLKRLREEEQQLLTDLDETREKMEQSAQQSQFADERSQLEKTRAEAQKAAESMEKGETTQALASGTRAQRDLQQMRDEFRKKTSGQFNEEMRQMRTNARDLASNEEKIAEKLKPKADPAPDGQKRRTLESDDQREQLEEKLAKQQADLGQLTRKMQVVSDQAENVEPLLAKELYDALRKTTQAGVGDTLEKTQQLAQLGNAPEAQKFEEKARKEIEDLKGGVERAAESVLGDEAEALRQARAELDTVRKELEREIAQARPDLAEGAAQAGGQKASGQNASSKNGQQLRDQGAERAGERAQTGGPKPAQAGDQHGNATGNQAGEQPGQRGQEDPAKPGEEKSTASEGKGQTASQGQGQKEGEGKGDSPSGRTAQTSEGKGKAAGQGKDDGQGAGGGGNGGNGGNAQTAGGDSSGNGGGPRAGGRLHDSAGQAREIGRNRNAGAGGAGGGASGGGGFDGGYGGGPLTGERFVEWSDRLRNVEEMVDDPALRTEVARIREIAKGMRVEFKQHQALPKWDMVKTKISAPLAELRNRLTEELARRESKESLVPIDRDPVPTQYAERVRRYYEELGRSR